MIIKNGKTIHLQGRNISYIMFESDNKDLLHFHFGAKLADCDYLASMCYPVSAISSHVSASPNHQCCGNTSLKQEVMWLRLEDMAMSLI